MGIIRHRQVQELEKLIYLLLDREGGGLIPLRVAVCTL